MKRYIIQGVLWGTISGCGWGHWLYDKNAYEARELLLTDNDRDGFHEVEGDCDDDNGLVYPGAEEICDQLDNDCDGDVDEDVPDAPLWYADADQDGFGADIVERACVVPALYSHQGGDCDDTNSSINPAEEEVWYDGLDNDCDRTTHDMDADADGFESEEYGGDDCDDNNDAVNPGAIERWSDDGIDNDCNGLSKERSLWSASEAVTRIDGVVTAGEFGRQLGYSEFDDCLLISAPFANEDSGMVYAVQGGVDGVLTADSLGRIETELDDAYLANT
ncbi:MAG: putative metal-binding motif-containing protein, partial [Myxococcota bacterium]